MEFNMTSRMYTFDMSFSTDYTRSHSNGKSISREFPLGTVQRDYCLQMQGYIDVGDGLCLRASRCAHQRHSEHIILNQKDNVFDDSDDESIVFLISEYYIQLRIKNQGNLNS